VVVLLMVSEADRAGIEEFMRKVSVSLKKPMPVLDLRSHQTVFDDIQAPPALNLTAPHHLFNPVKWQRNPADESAPIKIETGKEVGPDALVILKVSPLNFIVSWNKTLSGGGYNLGITNEAAANPRERVGVTRYCTVDRQADLPKSKLVALREVKGTPEEPTELVVEILETGEKGSVFKDKPYMRLDGYEADLKYTVDGRIFAKLRVGATLRFAGEEYKVLDVKSSEVVLSSNLNDKKYTVRQMAPR
jgi:hypothetical protein